MKAQTPLPRPAPDGDDTADLIVHLARLAQSGASAARLTTAQWTALRYFARANRFSRTPSAFSEFHATTRGTASQTIRALVEAGLLRRVEHGTDGRSTLIEVTAAGCEMLSADPLADLRAVLDAMPDDKRAEFTSVVQSALTQLAARRKTPVFGTCGACSHCEQHVKAAWCHCTQTWLGAPDMAALCVDFRPYPEGPAG